MTLLPWMVFFDRNGKIVYMPMKDAIRWRAALVYGPVVIRRFLEQPETPEKTVLWTYERMIDRTTTYQIDLEAVKIPLN